MPNLISCDSYVDKIYVHSGISATITTSFASPYTFPQGLAFDGVNLISCDSNADKIYVHSGISATITTSFASPSTSPTGLTYDDPIVIWYAAVNTPQNVSATAVAL